MTKLAVEHVFTGDTVGYESYDPEKTNLGKLIKQRTGATAADKYAGPATIGVGRPNENTTAFIGFYPHSIEISSTKDWIFLADAASASTTRRISLYEFDKSNSSLAWNGYITLSFPPTGNQTIRALRVYRHLYTTGTVEVTGTAVTGSGTAWQTARYAVGGRIGFGSTNPNSISTWYEISAIGSDTGITLASTAGSIAAGTSFVIEELRIVLATTNSTVANGGLYVAKGINYDNFTPSNLAIAAAVSTDNVKAVYWLKDASTNTNTASGGIGLLDPASNTSHICYVTNADAGTTARIYKYNLRAALTVSTGASTNAFVFKTGTATTTGTIAQTNSAKFATAGHGPGSGAASLYFATGTRIYRCAEGSIADGGTSFLTDAMIEIPTGGTATFAATGAFTSIDYDVNIDRFLIPTSTVGRFYLTKYNTNSDQFDHTFGVDTRQQDQSTADANSTPHLSFFGTAHSIEVCGSGMYYFCRNGTGSTNNQLYAVPMSAHWTYAVGTSDALQNRLISPELTTTGATKFHRIYSNDASYVGSDNLGVTTEPYRIYARSSGIDDDSGSWTLIDITGDASGIGAADSIQIMIEFKVAGFTCFPNRIFNIGVVYEDDTSDSHYEPSAGLSDASNNRFAWRFATAFGGSVPQLRVRLYNAATDEELVDDETSSATGTFERSTNGGSSWGSWDDTDKANEITYLRYTPASLGTGITVRALLTLA